MALSKEPNSEFTVRTLRLAMNKRKLSSRVMFHSNQGVQYTSFNFRRYENRQQAIANIIDYIELLYNQVRLHSRLGNNSPAQFE